MRADAPRPRYCLLETQLTLRECTDSAAARLPVTRSLAIEREQPAQCFAELTAIVTCSAHSTTGAGWNRQHVQRDGDEDRRTLRERALSSERAAAKRLRKLAHSS